MKRQFSIEAGRRWLLVILFVLLATMLVLIYLHPSVRNNNRQSGDYEQKIYNKWYFQAELLLKRGEWDNAANLALKILHSSPDDLFAQRVMICALAGKGSIEKAKELCRKVIFKNPEAAFCRNNLAVLLYPKEKSQAAAEISAAFRLMPEHPVIKYNFYQITGTSMPDDVKFPDASPDLLVVRTAPNGEKQ